MSRIARAGIGIVLVTQSHVSEIIAVIDEPCKGVDVADARSRR